MKKISILALALLSVVLFALGCAPGGNNDPKKVKINIEFADHQVSYSITAPAVTVADVITALNTQEKATVIEIEDNNGTKRIKSALNVAVDTQNCLMFDFKLNGATPREGISGCKVNSGDVITFSYNKVTATSVTSAPRNIPLSNGHEIVNITVAFKDYTATYSIKTDALRLSDAISALNEQEGYTLISTADSDKGKYVNKILSTQEDTENEYGYSFTVNGENAEYGISDISVSNGDTFVFTYGKINADGSITTMPRQ